MFARSQRAAQPAGSAQRPRWQVKGQVGGEEGEGEGGVGGTLNAIGLDDKRFVAALICCRAAAAADQSGRFPLGQALARSVGASTGHYRIG